MQLLFIKPLAFSVLINFINACPSGWNPSVLDAAKCYYIAEERMSWPDADKFCRNIGGPNSHLTSILSAFEANDISYNIGINNPGIGSLDQVWIGATGTNQDETFIWLDGSPFSYTNWLAGQPNLLYPCVSSLAKSSGKWRTEPCSTKNFFVCKYIMVPTATPTDCYDWHFKNGNSTDGIYKIVPPGIAPFDVWCDMTTDGGGWTVFQKRLDNSTIFWNRPWDECKNGFNTDHLDGNYWLGLDRIHLLSTKDTSVTLRIDLNGNRCTSKTYCEPFQNLPDGYWFGEWGFNYENMNYTSEFSVANESDDYRLHLTPYKAGNTSDSTDNFYEHFNGQKFVTRDHSDGGNYNCAVDFGFEFGPWWQNNGEGCYYMYLNGGPYPPKYATGFYFGFSFVISMPNAPFTYINPSRSQMKIRITS